MEERKKELISAGRLSSADLVYKSIPRIVLYSSRELDGEIV